MMLKKNAIIFYPTHGVCEISDISLKIIGSDTIECYHIHPLYEKNFSFLVPTSNKKATSKIRRVLSRREMSALIQDMPTHPTLWIENATARKKRYDEILESGDRRALSSVAKTLYLRRQSLKEQGKKLLPADEQCLQTAEKMLHGEVSHVLKIKRDEVRDFILAQVHKGDGRAADAGSGAD